MLRFIAHALAACVSIAAIVLLAPSASAQFPDHPRHQVLSGGVGPDPEDPEETGFAEAVAIRSGLAFISEPFALPGGRVAVYTATPTALIDTGITLSPSDPVTGGMFGQTLAHRGSILIVGSTQAAYFFQRNISGVWRQRQKLTPPPVSGVPSFVGGLRYEDGTLAIGASGQVYIYERNTAGLFIARGKLLSPDNRGFGTAISTAGPVMVVGGNGRAYVFRRNSTGVWRHQQTLIPSDLGSEAERSAFGETVAIDRGMIIVGAPRFGGADNPIEPEGAAYGFIVEGGTYVEAFKLQPRLQGYGDPYTYFGRLIAMFGERIVVGALVDFSNDAEDNGVSVFTYTRTGSSVLPRGIARQSGGFTTSLALADDRLLVGVPIFNYPVLGQGRAILYRLNRFE
jgi:hypothetical protein